jgi:MSHA biogenesis protein MshE
MAHHKITQLTEILGQQGLLTAEQITQAKQQQQHSGNSLPRILVENGAVTEKQISTAIACQMNLPFINLKNFKAEPNALHKLTEIQARRFRALILEDRGDTYLVGMADPTDLAAYDQLVRILRRDVELAVVSEGDVLHLIDRSYRRTEEITSLVEELGQGLNESAIDIAQLSSSANIEEAPIVTLLQTIFEDAVQIGASDIHIEPQERKLQIRFRIDGELHLQTEANSNIATTLVLRLKLMSGLDISEKRLPQDGRFAIKARQHSVDVRISSMPTQYGESVVMRMLIQSLESFSLNKLGMPPDMLERFRKIIHRPSGMVLVTGPTGSGKTTTLYAALSELNNISNKIITVEDPIEYRLAGINQVQVNDKIELTFSRVLRSALRQDPDIVMVGEMRDQQTARIGLRASMTGHLVLSTLHTNDAVSSPGRLLDMGVPPYMVAMSLSAVVAQRLVRVICENCKKSYTPQPFELAWLKLELGAAADTHDYAHGKGCIYCNSMGYQGRMGVYELLEMDAALVEAASDPNTNNFVKAARQKIAGKTMRKYAVDLVLEKRTTVAEAMRISNQFE